MLPAPSQLKTGCTELPACRDAMGIESIGRGREEVCVVRGSGGFEPCLLHRSGSGSSVKWLGRSDGGHKWRGWPTNKRSFLFGSRDLSVGLRRASQESEADWRPTVSRSDAASTTMTLIDCLLHGAFPTDFYNCFTISAVLRHITFTSRAPNEA